MSSLTPLPEPQASPVLDELSERELLDVAGSRRVVRRLAEVDEMLVAA